MEDKRKTYHGEMDCVTMRCSMEDWVKSKKCFVLIHDGSKSVGGHSGEQHHRANFTREYALVWGGKLKPYSIKFHYDFRDGMADFTIDDITRQVMSKLNKEVLPIEVPPKQLSNKFFSLWKWGFKPKDPQHNISFKDVIFFGFNYDSKPTKSKDELESDIVGDVLKAKEAETRI